jgi:hypothetical protein
MNLIFGKSVAFVLVLIMALGAPRACADSSTASGNKELLRDLHWISIEIDSSYLAREVEQAVRDATVSSDLLKNRAEQDLANGKNDVSMIEFGLAAVEPLRNGNIELGSQLMLRAEQLADHQRSEFKWAFISLLYQTEQILREHTKQDKKCSKMLLSMAHRQYIRESWCGDPRFLRISLELPGWTEETRFQSSDDAKYDDIAVESIVLHFLKGGVFDIAGLDSFLCESDHGLVHGCSPSFYTSFVIGDPARAEKVYKLLIEKVEPHLSAVSEIGKVPLLVALSKAQFAQAENLQATQTLEEAIQLAKKHSTSNGNTNQPASENHPAADTKAGNTTIDDMDAKSLCDIAELWRRYPDAVKHFRDALICAYALTKNRIGSDVYAFNCFESTVGFLDCNSETKTAGDIAAQAMSAFGENCPLSRGVRDTYIAHLIRIGRTDEAGVLRGKSGN